MELRWEETEHNLTLSGAEYEILLSAVNAAGPGPAQQLRVPAEQRAGTCPSRNAELPWKPSGRYFFHLPRKSLVSSQISASRRSAWPEAP